MSIFMIIIVILLGWLLISFSMIFFIFGFAWQVVKEIRRRREER